MENKRKVSFKKWIPRQMEQKSHADGTPYTGPVPGTGTWSDFTYYGYFHQWGLASQEDDRGLSSYSIGLVECSDGTVEEVLPGNLKFIDQQ